MIKIFCIRLDQNTDSVRKLEARLGVGRGWAKAFPNWDRVVYVDSREFDFERIRVATRWRTRYGATGAYGTVSDRAVAKAVLTFFRRQWRSWNRVRAMDGHELLPKVEFRLYRHRK